MSSVRDDNRLTPFHLPTALGCLALQVLFIGMCLYHNVSAHDYGGTLSTISFGSIYLATQSLIWMIASGRSVESSGSIVVDWKLSKVTVGLAAFFVIAVTAVVESPHLTDRCLSLSNPVTLSADGTELRLSGSIPSNLASAIRAVCVNGGCVAARRIVLHSDGGSFDGSIEGLQVLKSIGVSQATVDGNCEGVCVALWAGFGNSQVPVGSMLAIQGIYDPLTGQSTPDSIEQTRKLAGMLSARGLPRKVVDTALAYPSTHYYYLTGAEIDLITHEAPVP